jgi:hypothetical protein
LLGVDIVEENNWLQILPGTELYSARDAVIFAIGAGSVVELHVAWKHFQQSAEAKIDANIDTDDRVKAQIGLILAKADVWRIVGDTVMFVEELLSAEEYARNMGGSFERIVLYTRRSIGTYAPATSFRAEHEQASGDIEAAIEHYIEREQYESMSDFERGMVNFRLAECYWELIRQKAGDMETLRDHALVSIYSALEYLGEVPQSFWALRLLETIESH